MSALIDVFGLRPIPANAPRKIYIDGRLEQEVFAPEPDANAVIYKLCAGCKQAKPVSEFVLYRFQGKRCRECVRQNARDSYRRRTSGE